MLAVLYKCFDIVITAHIFNKSLRIKFIFRSASRVRPVLDVKNSRVFRIKKSIRAISIIDISVIPNSNSKVYKRIRANSRLLWQMRVNVGMV